MLAGTGAAVGRSPYAEDTGVYGKDDGQAGVLAVSYVTSMTAGNPASYDTLDDFTGAHSEGAASRLIGGMVEPPATRAQKSADP